MKNYIPYLLAAVIIGSAVYAIMHWLFHFNNDDAVLYGFIAATVEGVIKFALKIFGRRSKKMTA